MPRIAVAGFQHETNSFSTVTAELHQFEMADSWPGLLTGEAVATGTEGMNLPVAGFITAARAAGAEVLPVLWCAAEPSGPVTRAAFDTLSARILDGIARLCPLDAIYLDLHGAMITEDHDDGEGELLARLRARVGPDLPVAVSLDLHANVSPRMAALADTICIFRTYPHLDMGRTGARAWQRLAALLAGETRCTAFRQGGYLIPTHAQHTVAGPAHDLYAGLPDTDGAHVELALGFTAGDVADCGPSILAYAGTQLQADSLADQIAEALRRAEPAFDAPLLDADDAVSRAMRQSRPGPVVLADVQDNPGAGASSDTTGLLRALVRASAQGVLLGLMHDPELAGRAHAAGDRQEITGTLGGRSGVAGDSPYPGRFRVERPRDTPCRYTGEMYGGGVATLGPSAVLRILDTGADIRVVVTSNRIQCLDRGQFTHFGLDPASARILCVKSTAHFRADFEPLAAEVLCVAAPGGFPCRLSEAPLRNLRPGIRPAGAVAPGNP